MTRFLSEEWVDEFNAALEGAVLALPDDPGLAAADGTFVVVEEVSGAPGGDRRVVLRVDGGRLSLSLAPLDAAEPEHDTEDVEVTIALSYGDAAALSKGELTVAEALTSGRIRVRGDLSVLVSVQSMMAGARDHTAGLSASTTY